LSPKLQNLKHRGTEAAEEMKLDENALFILNYQEIGREWLGERFQIPLFPLLLRVSKVLAAG
jgi:predicted ATP-binding protein involved in virulence